MKLAEEKQKRNPKINKKEQNVLSPKKKMKAKKEPKWKLIIVAIV